ncbi:3-oxoacyl-[acyl-carrier-protein] reductase [Clostridium cochlearium]|jgi:3-oxoacyl-[acyl-carrier protein] reductase|uniref:3-oxoacyl-[acyl-carrier-protein] reductase n=1 Tax=Clostridium cochlearium TaxID=1494 RepID=A0A240B3V8_CLOCO|nr:3-oxoacyl-[acyl-carrier-protein] reductase [Clostridium cochlearium]MBE6065612.1 3-oxoacyl-[acyl-carrier-protein] reductase [Clostridium cochlearium]MBU5270235.1 3-oxoacyl-[acyl-carrier-protein] reductase [Clostridium cochlearium]MCR1972075.1 3-oxoacyl-[acyl-carrier-protein] reductase [Clostridium cochlearium]SDL03611.1 3-oxoacyl-[acyl-carrier-protein] reductase [Clostridium cochlearium]SNV90199.1 3-ketoacyl-ACP reductase [Clostridium cochlearium]
MMSYRPLENKTAIVTGGSRGIGKAIAMKLGNLGASIVLNYRSDTDTLRNTVKELEELNINVVAVKADISDYKECEKMIKVALDKFSKIDILVNNAGITADNLMLRMKEEEFDRVIKTNLKGTFNCVKHCTPIMIKKRYGKIINISSVVGISGNIGQCNYAAAKAGVIGLTKSLARELASRSINVNAIAPGFIETDMTNALSDKAKENIINSIPLKRVGKAEDVAELVAFLASDNSSYITGQVINVDGGMVI